MTEPNVPPAMSVPATPPSFRVRVYVLTPLELEKRRAGESFTPHFADKEYRLLWGTEPVQHDFSSAPPDVRASYEAISGGVDGARIAVPRAYYGTVGADGLVSVDVVDVRNGESVLEIGEYRDRPPSGLTAALWALDQRARRHNFNPLVRIPLARVDPPLVAEASRDVEIWWRLWNLGQIDRFQIHPRQPIDDEDLPGGDHSEHEGDDLTTYERQAGRIYRAQNQISKARWNHARVLLEATSFDELDDATLLDNLRRHHDREDPPR
ncbi:Hypothetical protein A7982_02437 [Minicystis rosea]|nr:Hypothetical protein A7982_02437 [Minicystis rosea]